VLYWQKNIDKIYHSENNMREMTTVYCKERKSASIWKQHFKINIMFSFLPDTTHISGMHAIFLVFRFFSNKSYFERCFLKNHIKASIFMSCGKGTINHCYFDCLVHQIKFCKSSSLKIEWRSKGSSIFTIWKLMLRRYNEMFELWLDKNSN
jgi:hypothetical protein